MAGTRADDFLQCDHVSTNRLQHFGDALRPRAAIEPVAPVHVVGGDAEHERRTIAHRI